MEVFFGLFVRLFVFLLKVEILRSDRTEGVD